MLLLIAGLLGFFWRVKWLRIVTLTLCLFTFVVLILPGRNFDSSALREAYVRSLKSYAGTRYVWGGENRWGIDGSGLVRAAMINAELREAARTLNSRLLRAAGDLWWHDCSALALSQEYRDVTRHLFDAPAIAAIDQARLQAGDIAVTDDGIHVLAFLGKTTWIGADPTLRRTVMVTLPTTNDWFSAPVKVMRWRVTDSTRKRTPSGSSL